MLLAIGIVCALLVIAPAVIAATTLTSGTYSGKTGQKVKVGFELAHSTVNCPGSAKSKFCLYQLDSQYAYLSLPCPGGSPDSVPEQLSPVVVPKNHILHKSFGQVDVAGRLTYYLKVAPKGTISGWFEESFSSAGGPVCKSGKVKFSTKRTGRVKN